MNLAIFTPVKPEEGLFSERQSRSLRNWQAVFRGADIIEFEGPLVPFRKMVAVVERDSDAELLMYANSDILFDKSQVAGLLRRLVEERQAVLVGEFLLTGQRVDMFLMYVSGKDWQKWIRSPA